MKLSKALLTMFIFLCAANSYAQTADEIISNHIKAIGGLDAWKKVQTMKMDAIIDANGTEINVAMAAEQSKGSRQTISLAGLQGFTLRTPTAGWRFFPWQGQMKPEAITPEEVKESQDELDVQGPLVDYKAKGHTAEYAGTDDFEGTDCYKIKLTQQGGKVVTYYIDPSNYFIIHTVTITKANGAENESKADYSNYKKLPEGIWMAMNVGSPGNVIKIKKVQVNVPIDDSVFKPSTN